MPVQYSYTSTPLSACTVQLYLYSPQYLYSTAIPLLPSVPIQNSYTSTPPIGRTACTEPQCLYSTAIPLLPSVPVEYSYTSTPPMGRTACTETQCLYKGALYLTFSQECSQLWLWELYSHTSFIHRHKNGWCSYHRTRIKMWPQMLSVS